MRRSLLLFVLPVLATACDNGPLPVIDTGVLPAIDGGVQPDTGINNPPPDTGVVDPPDMGVVDPPDAGDTPIPDAGNVMPTVIMGGNVSGMWSGRVQLRGSVTVPSTETLQIQAGTVIEISPNVKITVDGTMQLFGTADNRIKFDSTGTWTGVEVNGTFEGDGIEMSGATLCIDGKVASTITLNYARLTGCGRSMRLANGGAFTRTEVIGGNTLLVTGGSLDMTDSVIDLRHAFVPPDCTDWAGGGAVLDHVRFTGCHCPLHFNSTTLPVRVTNSVFDEGANAVMIARTTATFTGNNFISSEATFLDIGGAISADVAGNYWGGGAPVIATGNQNQFRNSHVYETMPVAGAGPR